MNYIYKAPTFEARVGILEDLINNGYRVGRGTKNCMYSRIDFNNEPYIRCDNEPFITTVSSPSDCDVEVSYDDFINFIYKTNLVCKCEIIHYFK